MQAVGDKKKRSNTLANQKPERWFSRTTMLQSEEEWRVDEFLLEVTLEHQVTASVYLLLLREVKSHKQRMTSN